MRAIFKCFYFTRVFKLSYFILLLHCINWQLELFYRLIKINLSISKI